MRTVRLTLGLLLLSGFAAGGVAFWRQRRAAPLPAGVTGVIVFVSDRHGQDELYVRRLPGGEERRLTFEAEPVGEPALSSDGRQVAFSMGGRIGVVPVAGGDPRFVTLGIDWQDATPSWRSDGLAIVVAARRAPGEAADIHLLSFDDEGAALRKALTDTPGLDETAPAFSPLDGAVVFVREDGLFRIDPKDGKPRRLTAGFKKTRCPRFLPSGRLICLWNEGKQYGIDVMDPDGKNRETLAQGPVYYRTVAPSPDGRFLAATFTFDLGFHPLDLLKLRQTEEVRLLELSGGAVTPLARSWLHASHSPDWGR
jgi:Tol biopolymer transport system component